MLKNFKKKIKAYALKNSISYKGNARISSVLSSLFNEGLKPEDSKKYIPEIKKIIDEVNSLSLKEKEKEFEKLKEIIKIRKGRIGLPEIPNTEKVVMRFAPSASGPLHIGHALTASISFLLVKKYNGKFYIRIEDTNPENIYPKAYQMIKEEADWLFKKDYILLIQSERIELYYKYCEKLIKKERAYVCVCSSENFKKNVEEKKPCPCRKNNIKQNLNSWKKMVDKNGFKEGQAVLRFKSDKGMKDKNPAMRDFPLARINLTKHALQKNKYRVWPLMNLAVSVDDIELGMTHIIRAKEHRDNAKRQEMIYNALGLKNKIPWTSFLGRIKFRDLDLSTTKIKKDIEEKKYSGWDDEKLPTICSIMKRNYSPELFWKFAERIGFSESDKIMEKKEFFEMLNSFKKIND